METVVSTKKWRQDMPHGMSLAFLVRLQVR